MPRYRLSLIKFPSGKFGWVGSVPVVLCKENYSSKVYDNEHDAIQDAGINGIIDYDVCTW